MIKKTDIRDALKSHHDAVQKIKQGLLENDGEKVAAALEAAQCAWDRVEDLLIKKYPQHLEAEDDDEPDAGKGEEEEEELDEEEEEEEDDD